MRSVGKVALVILLAAMPRVAAQNDEPPTPYLVLDGGGHTAAVAKVRFTPDGQQLLTASRDKTIRLWDLHTGESVDVLRTPRGAGVAGILNALAISPDGQWLAAGGLEQVGADHGIYLLHLPQRRLAAVLRGHSNVILDLAFSGDGRLLASASADRTARLWDVGTKQNLATLRGHREAVYAVTFSPDDAQLATASLDHTATVWSVRSGQQAALLHGHSAPLQAIAWRPDGKQLATGCVDQSVYLWTPDGQLQRRLEKLGNHVTSLRYTRDARELFFTLGGEADRDGGFFLNVSTNQLGRSFVQHADSVLAGDISPDGALAATADAGGEVCVWHTRDSSLLYRFRSAGHRAWSAAWDAQQPVIAWGYTSSYVSPSERGPLEFAFSLAEFDWTVLNKPLARRAQTALPTIALEPLDARTVLANRSGRQSVPLKLPAQHDQVR